VISVWLGWITVVIVVTLSPVVVDGSTVIFADGVKITKDTVGSGMVYVKLGKSSSVSNHVVADGE
jgi:divalent metal cation (Fe/Co/Zn/Cd) transporter